MKYISIFLLNFLFLSVYVKDANSTTIPVGDWHVLYVQDQQLSSVISRNDWEPIQIPSTFKAPSTSSEKFQYLWLRGEFNISDDISNYYGINLGRIYHTDTVYINSIYVGSVNQDEINELHIPRYYIIPGGALKSGKNVVYIRLGIFSNEYGGFKSKICIQDRKTFLKGKIIDDFFINSLPFAIAILYFGAVMFLALLFFFYTSTIRGFWVMKVGNQLLFSNSALIFFVAIILYIFSPYKIFDFSSVYLDLTYLVHLTIIPIVTINILFFIQSLNGQYLIGFNFIAVTIYIIISGMFFINKIYFKSQQIDIIFFSVYFISSIILFTYLLKRLNSLKPNRFIKNTVIIFLISAGATIATESIMYLTGQCNSGLSTVYASPLIFLILLIMYSRDIVGKWFTLDRIYYSLRISVQNQDNSGQKLSITNDSEEKLQQVIKFINENYTSDLTREGIAAAVDMTPGYLGRLFISYTGKKVNNYINDLRVQMAVEKLNDLEVKIIDIAYSVGFESLSTFNRAFKNCTGKTPTDYREELIKMQ